MNQTAYTDTATIVPFIIIVICISILGFIWIFPEQYNWIENKLTKLFNKLKK